MCNMTTIHVTTRPKGFDLWIKSCYAVNDPTLVIESAALNSEGLLE